MTLRELIEELEIQASKHGDDCPVEILTCEECHDILAIAVAQSNIPGDVAVQLCTED